jgi:hypothetical protein
MSQYVPRQQSVCFAQAPAAAQLAPHWRAAVHTSPEQHEPCSPPQLAAALPQHVVPLAMHWCDGAQHGPSPHITHPSPSAAASSAPPPSPAELGADESVATSPSRTLPDASPERELSWPSDPSAKPALVASLAWASRAEAHVLNPHVKSPSTPQPASEMPSTIVEKRRVLRIDLIMRESPHQRKCKTGRAAASDLVSQPLVHQGGQGSDRFDHRDHVGQGGGNEADLLFWADRAGPNDALRLSRPCSSQPSPSVRASSRPWP